MTLFKQCAFDHVDLENITMGCPDLVQGDSDEVLMCTGLQHPMVSFGTHINECTLLDNVMCETNNETAPFQNNVTQFSNPLCLCLVYNVCVCVWHKLKFSIAKVTQNITNLGEPEQPEWKLKN